MRETAMVQPIETKELLYEVQEGLGWITLNRPKALNALSTGMIRSLAASLGAWEVDPSIKAVIIQGAGDKAFCAGGDVRAVYEAKRAGKPSTL
jgi:enoyl-CoA hydratase